jgi:hypothetical protein
MPNQFSWNEIVSEFSCRYIDAINKEKKIHLKFHINDEVIHDAKDGWQDLLLLDAVIYVASGRYEKSGDYHDSRFAQAIDVLPARETARNTRGSSSNENGTHFDHLLALRTSVSLEYYRLFKNENRLI